ncbi:MAG: MFS transporter [Ilumatobacteraceae bacterium]
MAQTCITFLVSGHPRCSPVRRTRPRLIDPVAGSAACDVSHASPDDPCGLAHRGVLLTNGSRTRATENGRDDDGDDGQPPCSTGSDPGAPERRSRIGLPPHVVRVVRQQHRHLDAERRPAGVRVRAHEGSASIVGLLVFAQLGPLLLLSIPAGVIADRFDRRRWLIVMQLVQLRVLDLAVPAGRHRQRRSGRCSWWRSASVSATP